MLIGVVIVQFVLMAFTAGWFMARRDVNELRESNEELDRILNVQSNRIEELQHQNKQLEEKCESLTKLTPKVNASNPLDNVLSALIEETNAQDEAETKRLKEIKSAWNFQPVASSKRMKGDS